MNTIILHGRIGKDPEVTEKNGNNGPFKKASFSFAVDRIFGDQTDWFRCEATGRIAETIEKYGHTGKPLIVTGSMESYKTDRDEFVHWKVRIQSIEFEKGEKKGASTGGNAPSTASTANNNASTEASTTADTFEDIDEDVPF